MSERKGRGRLSGGGRGQRNNPNGNFTCPFEQDFSKPKLNPEANEFKMGEVGQRNDVSVEQVRNQRAEGHNRQPFANNTDRVGSYKNPRSNRSYCNRGFSSSQRYDRNQRKGYDGEPRGNHGKVSKEVEELHENRGDTKSEDISFIASKVEESERGEMTSEQVYENAERVQHAIPQYNQRGGSYNRPPFANCTGCVGPNKNKIQSNRVDNNRGFGNSQRYDGNRRKSSDGEPWGNSGKVSKEVEELHENWGDPKSDYVSFIASKVEESERGEMTSEQVYENAERVQPPQYNQRGESYNRQPFAKSTGRVDSYKNPQSNRGFNNRGFSNSQRYDRNQRKSYVGEPRGNHSKVSMPVVHVHENLEDIKSEKVSLNTSKIEEAETSELAWGNNPSHAKKSHDEDEQHSVSHRTAFSKKENRGYNQGKSSDVESRGNHGKVSEVEAEVDEDWEHINADEVSFRPSKDEEAETGELSSVWANNPKNFKNPPKKPQDEDWQQQFSYKSASSKKTTNMKNVTKQTFDHAGKKEDNFDYYDRKIRKLKMQHTRVVEVNGDLFSAGKEYAMAHCVAEDMNMGSGIALMFRKTFKDVGELMNQKVRQGGLAVLNQEGRYIYYLVTKRESNGKPTLLTLHKSVTALKEHMVANDVKKIAIPRIGCGLDRLEWSDVKNMLEFIFEDTEIEIKVFNFQQADEQMHEKKTDHKFRKCRVETLGKTLNNYQTRNFAMILFLGTEQDDVTPQIKAIDEKFNIIKDYRAITKKIGEHYCLYRHNGMYCIVNIVVKKRWTDDFNFVPFESAIFRLNKDNVKAEKTGEKYNELVMHNYYDQSDDLLMPKLTNLMSNTFYQVHIGFLDV